MMLTLYFYISVSILFFTNAIHCLDLCNTKELIRNNITSYRYKYEKIQECGCSERNECVKKCCAIGYNMGMGVCIWNGKTNFILPIYKQNISLSNFTPVNYVVGVLKHCDFYPKRPLLDQDDSFYLQENLKLFLPSENKYLSPESYCLDYTDQDGLIAILCIDEPVCTMELTVKINYIGMIISMPFLLVTFIVYALLPDRNLHMKALMCYVINLLHAYIFLVIIQLTDEVIENTICAILGFCCIFFFLASFFWMNVICIDIFLGFRGFRGIRGVKSSERKRFLLYCLYAWGMSLFIVGLTFLCNEVGNPGQWFYPGVAVGQCFLRSGLPELLYFYGPMGIIIILNVVLFTLTAYKIRQVKKDTAMLKHSESKRHSDDDQQNFNLYFKLLLAMGVNWSMELVSWAVNLNHNAVPQYIWYLSDFCNATYGVFIFFIFVFKRNIWKQLKRRYYSFLGKHHLAHSMATTNQTKTTNDSMTTSVNDRIALEESELNASRIH